MYISDISVDIEAETFVYVDDTKVIKDITDENDVCKLQNSICGGELSSLSLSCIFAERGWNMDVL